MPPGILEKTYLAEAFQPAILKPSEGIIEWKCPSNIALVKYWGKKHDQLPVNPSMSVTLTKCSTSLRADYTMQPDAPFKLEFLFEGKPNPLFEDRIASYFRKLIPYFPIINNLHIKLESSNSFPHSSGIASSASFFGAMALVVCSIQPSGGAHTPDFFRKASFMARLGSGSACRSVFGGLSVWGETSLVKESSDEAALPLTDKSRFLAGFRDSVLIVSAGTKSVSSSHGHELMKNHPFREARMGQSRQNLDRILRALNSGDMNDFLDVTETEALTLHALMMTSDPGYILIRPETLEIITRIREFRRRTGNAVGFTLDAGPNVHVLYPESSGEIVMQFIEKELLDFCEGGKVIHDVAGAGPVKIS
jgi:diphosphomevalonate decarboxylase